MSQSDVTPAAKFSLLLASIRRFFLLLMVMLLVMMGVIVYSATTRWLKDKSDQVASVAQALHQRIASGRYASWQSYDIITAANRAGSGQQTQETQLRQDIYYLEKPHLKTEALIFGPHNSATLESARRISDYLDTLWGAKTIPWSMYYLNTQDNSMILISTLPLKDLFLGFQEPITSSTIASRRAEMLRQANTLDERESFSPLRHLSWQNSYYFTLRTTFNQPGYLPLVVASDLPINDLIPQGMSAGSFRLEPDNRQNNPQLADKEQSGHVRIHFHDSHTEIASAIDSTNMRLLWQLPSATLALDILQNISLPLLCNLVLLALALFGYINFRKLPGSPSDAAVASNALSILRAMSEEIVSLLPLGLLIHDQQANRVLISNEIADRLLPYLKLRDITSMADQSQGVIQTTINNELYEIRQLRSQVMPQAQIFIIRDQDKEVLVSKKLKQAQRLYEKNQQDRVAFMRNIGEVLTAPAKALAQEAAALPATQGEKIASHADSLVQLVEEIQLANRLENNGWQSRPGVFSVQDLIDALVTEILPSVRRKGLRLLVNNHLPVNEQRFGDSEALRRMLLLLTRYAITSTPDGRITLEINSDDSTDEGLMFRILDTGAGISPGEMDNLRFPLLGATQSDRYGKANGLAFWLCDQLARHLGGYLHIKTRDGLGTRYALHMKMAISPAPGEAQECLLDEMVAMVDVSSSEIRHIVVRLMTHWGASCITPDGKAINQKIDLFLTDNPSNLTTSGLLLSDDECDIRQISPGRLCVNFNLSNAMRQAVLQLIEARLAQESAMLPLDEDEKLRLRASGYYALFIDTVPDDVKRLYTEAATSNFAALAQTAHRLKGVFAMLNMLPGKQLCETLEHLIVEKDVPGIDKYISDIDACVKSLL